MTTYREYRYWSPLMGCEAARISMSGGQEAARHHGEPARTREWFAIIPTDPGGKHYRERRDRAMDAIEDAIADGEPPGEVTVRA